MNRINVAIIIEQVQRIAESQAGVNSHLTIKDGIVYINFPDGSYIDFTRPKFNPYPPVDSLTDQQRYDSVSVTGSGRKV